MTYDSNIERLKLNARNNLTRKDNNLKQTIKNIEKKEEEDIAAIRQGTELLIGGGTSAFGRGYTGKEFTEEGDGIIPTLYGKRVARKHKEGWEASKKDEEDKLAARLLELQTQNDSNKNIDTALHEGKYQLLRNGENYEVGSRYTKLSPHAQWAYIQQKIGTFNNTIQDKAWHAMSKDTDPFTYKGYTFIPQEVHSDPEFPLLLKEAALSATIERIKTESGLNNYSDEALIMGGVLDDPTKEGELQEGSLSRTKRVLMAKYRTGFTIDESAKTRGKIISEAIQTGVWDVNRIITVFKGTVDQNNNLLNNDGAWVELNNLLIKEAVNGSLKGESIEPVLDKIGAAINPETNTPYSISRKPQLEALRREIEKQRKAAVDTDIDNLAISQQEVKLNFLSELTKLRKEKGPNFKVSESTYDFVLERHLAAGGSGIPTYLANAYTTLTGDDKQQIERINAEIAAGQFDPVSSLIGVSPQVKALFNKKGANGTSKIEDYNNSGSNFLTQNLKSGGYYSDLLDGLTLEMSGNAGVKGDYKFTRLERKIRYRMEQQFRTLFLNYKLTGNMSDTNAAIAAMKDIEAQSMVDGKRSSYGVVMTAQGLVITGNPLKDSPFARDELWEQPASVVAAESELIDNSNIWIKTSMLDPNFGKGSNNFLQTPKGFIPGSHEYLIQAQEYYKGNRHTVPNFYEQIANKLDGVSALQLMQWQLAGQGVDWKKLNVRKRPTSADALDLNSHNRFRSAFGFKPTTCSKLGVVCATVDVRNQGNEASTKIESEIGITRGDNGEISIPLDSQDPVTLETRPVRLQEPIIPKGYTLEDGKVKSDTGGLFDLTNEQFWQGSYRLGDTRNIGDQVETLTETAEGNKWMSEAAIQEHRLNTGTELDGTIIPEFQWLKKLNISVSNIEAQTKDVPENIINAYGGGLEGRAKYLAAKLRYEADESKFAVNPGLGITSPSTPYTASGSQIIDHRVFKGIDFKDLTTDQHAELDTTWYFEDKVDENWYRQFTVPSDRNTIRQWSIKLQKAGLFDPDIHYLIPQPLKGNIFGIEWEIPVKQGRPLIVPKNLQSNLQSVFNAPDSPYLAESLRDYSAQLFVKNVATELTT